MKYQLVHFTAGREGFGYLEVPSDAGEQTRLLDVLGQPIPERVVEYHVEDVSPPLLGWMQAL